MSSIPPNFELVVGLAALSTLVHHGYMANEVGRARKKYGVNYPDLYASKDNCKSEEDIKAFNCVQRGHQNSLELHPAFLTLMTLAGLKHPIVAAASGTSYIIGRVFYFSGYSTGAPEKRLRGSPIYGAGFLALVVTCSKIALAAAFGKKK